MNRDFTIFQRGRLVASLKVEPSPRGGFKVVGIRKGPEKLGELVGRIFAPRALHGLTLARIARS